MNSDSLLKEINAIFIDIMDNDKIVLTSDSTANEIEEWDSLTHIQVIVAIEKHFKIKFSSTEIRDFKNVGQLCESVRQKLS